MKFLGRYKAGATIKYSVQFHDDNNTTVDPTSPAARHRKPDDTFDDFTTPAKLDTKLGWFGGSIDTTGFATGSHEIRISGTVSTHEVATIYSFEIIANTHADLNTAIGALNDPTAASIADAVWDELHADHQTLTTFGGVLRILKSIAQYNV